MEWEEFFLDILKKNIHMSREKCKSNLQVTLEDDFNVPDSKPDIDKIITEDGTIEILEKNVVNGKCMMKGVLRFQLLYVSGEEGQLVHTIQGKISIDEMINMEGITPEDEIKINWNIEDLSISLINSRKISVKSVVYLSCKALEICEEEVAVGVDNAEGTQCKYENMPLTRLVVDKKDIFRIKENFHLPTGKPNIYEVLYHNLYLQGVEMRAQDEQIGIRGELVLFVLYRTQEDNQRVQYFQAEQPFHTSIPCSGIKEDMVLQIEQEVITREIQIKPDEDGEEREIETEYACNLGIKIYQDEEVKYLADLYSIDKDLQIEEKEQHFQHLLTKNNFQKRITEQISQSKDAKEILQICHSQGWVQVEEQEWRDNGIFIEGTVEIKILYISPDDRMPMGEIKASIPFSHTVEWKNPVQNVSFQVLPQLEQLHTMLLGKDGIEVKINLNLETFLFENISKNMIHNINWREISVENMEEIPSMVGYLVKPGEQLWEIAKRFHTTVEEIMEMNHLEEEAVKKGDKILLMKKVQAI